MAMRLEFPRPQFTLKTVIVTVACCALTFWAAPRVWDYFGGLWYTPSAFDRGWFAQELHAWPEAARRGKVPGIGKGSCVRVRTGQATGFVIWTDFRWSPNSQGGRTHGLLSKADKEGEWDVVQWQWNAVGGKAGTLMINGEAYIVDKGTLFLVSTQDGDVRLKQFDKDALALLDVSSDRLVENLQALAKSDKEISGFFVHAAKQK